MGWRRTMTEEEIKQKIGLLFNHPNRVIKKEGALCLALTIYRKMQSQLTEKDKQIENQVKRAG